MLLDHLFIYYVSYMKDTVLIILIERIRKFLTEAYV